MSLSATTPAAWTERYEALRQHFLDAAQVLETPALGLRLVFCYGVAAWMQSWDEPAGPQICPPLSAPQAGGTQTADWQQQLTVLLAQMTAAHLPWSTSR
jgi:hypothetical protein